MRHWVGSDGAAGQQSLRHHNLAVVALSVFTAPAPLSRAEVAATIGVAKGTVSTLVDRLVEARLVRELAAATAPQRAGRPAVTLAPGSRSIVGMGLEVNVGYVDPLPLLRLPDVPVEVANEARLAGLAQLPVRVAPEDSESGPSGLPLDAPVERLVAAFRDGDDRARRGVRNGGQSLGQALATFVNLLDVDTVVPGGIFTDLLPLIEADVRTMLERHVLASRWALVVAPGRGARPRCADRRRPRGAAGHTDVTPESRALLHEVVASPSEWVSSPAATASP